MKEVRYFYAPDALNSEELPLDEAMHALRVLRLKAGDEIILMDGQGNYFQSEVTLAHTKHCFYHIKKQMPQPRQWQWHLHLGIAPTKMMERLEWMVEKSVEVGIDEISFLNCQFSERRLVKIPRLEKIMVSAVKQSRKAWITKLNELDSFSYFVTQQHKSPKFIAHCYEEIPRTFLFDELCNIPNGENVTVLIGPEGDFSIDEVRLALQNGYRSVHLGESRLRTETAGLAAVMMMQLSRRNKD